MFVDEYEYESVYGEIESNDVTADIYKIMRYLCKFDEQRAESEALRDFFVFRWKDDKLKIIYCQTYETNESWMGNTDYTETKTNEYEILCINATIFEYTNLIISVTQNRQELKHYYGNRINLINFERV